MPSLHTHIQTPVGLICALSDGQYITGLYMPGHKGWHGTAPASQPSDAPFKDLRRQLAEYFAGARQTFDLPLSPHGTPFQQSVWHQLRQIPFGVTITYAQLAHRIGNAAASRAVGAANGRNPISILIPCHRVIGSSGKLTGYAAGLAIKNQLLTLERQSP